MLTVRGLAGFLRTGRREIWVDSRVGEGASFAFTLPRAGH